MTKNRNGYDELKSRKQNNHELLHTPTTTSGYEIAGNGSDNDAAQVKFHFGISDYDIGFSTAFGRGRTKLMTKGNDWQIIKSFRYSKNVLCYSM